MKIHIESKGFMVELEDKQEQKFVYNYQDPMEAGRLMFWAIRKIINGYR